MANAKVSPAPPAPAEQAAQSRRALDIWVCEGRVCTSKGAGALAEQAQTHLAGVPNCRVLRGGCYGQCDLSPNVIVREHDVDALPDIETNRLSRTFEDNEVVYATINAAGLTRLLDVHIEGTGPLVELTLEARERLVPPANDIAARIRALRKQKEAERESS